MTKYNKSIVCVCTTIFLLTTFISQTSCKNKQSEEDLNTLCFDIIPISTNSTAISVKDKLCPVQDCLDTENTWKDNDYSNGADGHKHEKINNSMLVALLLMIVLW